jgi:hypothetical protein
MTTTPIPGIVTGEPDLQRSSCEIKTSTRGADLTVKVYAGSPVQPACDEAFVEYGRLMRLLREAQDNNWADTVALVRRAVA